MKRQFLFSLVLFAALAGCASPHDLGRGAATPEDAIAAFITDVGAYRYEGLREIVYYDQPCHGFLGLFLDPGDPRAIERYMNDHAMLVASEPLRTQLLERINQQGRAQEHPITPYLRSGRMYVEAEDHYTWRYPAPMLTTRHTVQAGASGTDNSLHIRRHAGRWYVYNLQCTAVSGVVCPNPRPEAHREAL